MFGLSLLRLYQLVKVTSICILHHYVESFLITETGKILNDVGMSDLLQDLDLFMGITPGWLQMFDLYLLDAIGFLISLTHNFMNDSIGTSSNLIQELEVLLGQHDVMSSGLLVAFTFLGPQQNIRQLILLLELWVHPHLNRIRNVWIIKLEI